MNNPIQDTECLHSVPLYYKLSRFSGEICFLQTFRAVLIFDSTLGAPLGVPQNKVSHLEGSFQENWGQLSSLARIFQLLNTISSLNGFFFFRKRTEISKFSQYFEFDLVPRNNLASFFNVHDGEPLRSPSLLFPPAP